MKREVRGGIPAEIRADDDEEWRPSPTSADYEVSSAGRVRRATTSKRGHPSGMVIRPRPLPSGYLRVTEAGGGQRPQKDRYIHRLVCEAFHGPAPAEGYEVAHIDGCKTNNHASNLRWATHADNERDKIKHGTRLKGTAIAQSKLAPPEISAIRELIGTLPQRAIAKRFGVCQMTISKIARQVTWRCV